MQVGFWSELLNKTVASGTDAAGNTTTTSLADAVVKNGVSIINAYGAAKQARYNQKTQKYGGTPPASLPPGNPAYYGGGGGGGYYSGGSMTDLLGQNGPLIIGGLTAAGILYWLAKGR